MTRSKKPMSPAAAARIQSATAKQNGGITPKGSFAAKAQSAAAQNMATSKISPGWPSKTGGKSGRGRDNNPPKK